MAASAAPWILRGISWMRGLLVVYGLDLNKQNVIHLEAQHEQQPSILKVVVLNRIDRRFGTS